MDAVITYVNMNDPEWIKSYKEKFDDEPNIKRFKDLGTLNLQIRCIRKFMSWINKIYVVVSSESQVDVSLEVGVEIITHSQIIPAEYLPTFNSCTIEMFLYKIPNLSEYFIYFNDDIFPIDYIDEKEFFDEKPILSFKTIKEYPINKYRWQCKNSSNLARLVAGIVPSKEYIKSDHICTVHSKAAYESVWSKASNTILDSLTPKREAKNFNQYLFNDYLFYTGQCKIKRLDYLYIQYTNIFPEYLYEVIHEQQHKLICIQDDEQDERYNKLLIKALEELTVNNNTIDLVVNISNDVWSDEQEKKEQYFHSDIDVIDLVVPYVDNKDPNWQKLYNQYVSKDDGYGANDERFRGYNLFKYFFRGVDKYMPFIRTVHVIVQSESQIPDWLDANKVHIVKHEDFIPKEYLPCFNSCTIEMFLYKIPGLAEKFIYANDDYYVVNEMSEKDFFDKGVPVYGYKLDRYIVSRVADKIRYNIHKLVTGKDDYQVERIQHVFIPYLKSNIIAAVKKYKKDILDSITRVRTNKNLSQWLFAVYQIYKCKYINKTIPHVRTKIADEKLVYLDNLAYKVICFNDVASTTEEQVEKLECKLSKILKDKSKFER